MPAPQTPPARGNDETLETQLPPPPSAQEQADREFADRAMKLVTGGLMVGEALLRSQVATSDVESAIRRLNAAFGLDRIEVSVTLNQIQLSIVDPRIPWPVSAMRMVDLSDVRLDLLVQVETLIRSVEAGHVGLHATIAELEKIAATPNPRSRWFLALCALASVAGWVVFVGGGIAEVGAALAAAVVIQLVVVPLTRGRLPEAFGIGISATLVVAGPTAAAWMGIPIAVSPATVGALYPLLPGGLLVAAVTDGLSGAPISAMAKGVQAAVQALAVAIGALGALIVVQELEISSTAAPPEMPAVVMGAAAAVAVAGIALSRSMPWRLVPTLVLLTIPVWYVLELLPARSTEFPYGSFLAAIVLGAGGQLLSRIVHTSPTVYTTNAVFVLVPGFTMYLAMVAFAQGDNDPGFELLIRAIGISLAIAAGISLGVALTRQVPLRRPRVVPWQRRIDRSDGVGPSNALGRRAGGHPPGEGT